jgi:hypothetical protein
MSVSDAVRKLHYKFLWTVFDAPKLIGCPGVDFL